MKDTWKVDVVIKGKLGVPCGDGNIMFLDCINITVRCCIIIPCFCKMLLLGEVDKGLPDFSVLFVTTANESTIISK